MIIKRYFSKTIEYRENHRAYKIRDEVAKLYIS